MASDEDLLERSLGGDTAAFGALVERHESAVCAVSFSVTGDRGVSEEVAQETFLTAWRSLSTLREPSRFKAWACGIARNLARKARATRARLVAATSEPVDPAPHADELLDSRSREAAVWASLESLSPTYREPLVLFYREGRSTRDVAKALGLSVSTVEQRLSRGRKQLRAEVMDLVERTLEDAPPRGRISAAVLATIGVEAIPPGGNTASHTTTMKTALIASTLAATVGLGVYAANSTTQGQAPADGGRIVTAPDTSHSASSAVRAEAHPESMKDENPKRTASTDASPQPQRSLLDDAEGRRVTTAFEITTMGPNQVAMNVRGGRSNLVSGPFAREPGPVIGHVEGVVRTPDGTPLAQAVVLGGPTISLLDGSAFGSQAGALSDDQGRFALPVYQTHGLAILAAHHAHGMSRASTVSTEEGDVELRLEPFAWIEGTVHEGSEGVPAHVMLRGSGVPLGFVSTTNADGTYRIGPLPPGNYTAAASTGLGDSGHMTHFRDLKAHLKPDATEHLDFHATEGPMLVLESRLPKELDVESVQLGVFSGRREIASLEAFDALTRSVPRGEYQGLLRRGVDAHNGDASFSGLEPGTYTGCLAITLNDGTGSLDCRTIELGENDVEVIDFGSK